MRRDLTSQAWAQGSIGAMKNWRYIAMHSVAAAAFIFLLQRYALNASLETSLMWMLAFGGCAAVLATVQSNR
jgi:hypothetical protein